MRLPSIDMQKTPPNTKAGGGNHMNFREHQFSNRLGIATGLAIMARSLSMQIFERHWS
jgi:hypothetical protein